MTLAPPASSIGKQRRSRAQGLRNLLDREGPRQAHGEDGGTVDFLDGGIRNGRLDLLGHPVEEGRAAQVSHRLVDFEALHVDDAHALGGGLVAVELHDGNAEGGAADVQGQIGALLAAGGELVVVRRQHADVAHLQLRSELSLQLSRHVQQLRGVEGSLEQALDLAQEVVDRPVIGSQSIPRALP